jgi:hypothetical protein
VERHRGHRQKERSRQKRRWRDGDMSEYVKFHRAVTEKGCF